MFSQRAVTCGVDICKEMTVNWWVVDSEVVLQLGDGIDGPRLGSAINIFAVFGALCVGLPEDCHVVAVVVGSRPDIGVLNVHCRVKAVEGGDHKFACLDQSEEGGSKARPHCCIEQITGVQLAKEHLNESKRERFSFRMF